MLSTQVTSIISCCNVHVQTQCDDTVGDPFQKNIAGQLNAAVRDGSGVLQYFVSDAGAYHTLVMDSSNCVIRARAKSAVLMP